MENQMYEKILEVKGTAKRAIRRIMPDIGLVLSGIKRTSRMCFFLL